MNDIHVYAVFILLLPRIGKGDLLILITKEILMTS